MSTHFLLGVLRGAQYDSANRMRNVLLKGKKGLPPLGSKKNKTCESKWCRNLKARNSTGYLLKHCWKCRSRMLKERQEPTYVLNMVRHSARKRGLTFTLTIGQFKDFCERTGYLHRRGTKSDSLTIDRIDHSKGYHVGNITVSTHIENSTKGHHVPGEFRDQNHRRNLEGAGRQADSETSENPF